jgi:hypothetical protein
VKARLALLAAGAGSYLAAVLLDELACVPERLLQRRVLTHAAGPR